VLLSGCDDLMNAQQVKAMLEQFDHIKVGQEPSPPALLACCGSIRLSAQGVCPTLPSQSAATHLGITACSWLIPCIIIAAPCRCTTTMT
jgi:hypothetical protein